MPQKQLDRSTSTTIELRAVRADHRVPEYYLTRSERSLLLSQIPRTLQACGRALWELGAGAPPRRESFSMPCRARRASSTYLSVSRDFLEETATRLREIYPQLEITSGRRLHAPVRLRGSATNSLRVSRKHHRELRAGACSSHSPSNRSQMCPDDRFILGADLRKISI